MHGKIAIIQECFCQGVSSTGWSTSLDLRVELLSSQVFFEVCSAIPAKKILKCDVQMSDNRVNFVLWQLALCFETYALIILERLRSTNDGIPKWLETIHQDRENIKVICFTEILH